MRLQFNKPIDTNNVFVISDLHLGHKNILRFEPSRYETFGTIENMDVALIDMINEVLNEQSKLIILGDVAFNSKAMNNVNRLKGERYLVLGNHDNFGDDVYVKRYGFKGVYNIFEFGGILFSHYPVHPSEIGDGTSQGGRYIGNVHGHTHGRCVEQIPTSRYLNVCCENVKYKPVSLTSILNYYEGL